MSRSHLSLLNGRVCGYFSNGEKLLSYCTGMEIYFFPGLKASLSIMCAFLNALERTVDPHSGCVTAKQLIIRI